MYKIGVFDSGIGGLTVLSALINILRNYNVGFVYFADNANIPYGSKTKEEIINLSADIVSWMEELGDIGLIVAACHTSSAVGINHISSNIPIIGMVRPFIDAIINIDNTLSHKVGLLVTKASAASGAHETALRNSGFKGEVFTIPCEDSFVEIVESGRVNTLQTQKILQDSLEQFAGRINTLVYGCTHYPLLHKVVINILGERIRYINPAVYVAKEVALRMKRLLDYIKDQECPDLSERIMLHCSDSRKYNSLVKITRDWCINPKV